jgi:ubiquinone biosynthesis monooxygenase Coq7
VASLQQCWFSLSEIAVPVQKNLDPVEQLLAIAGRAMAVVSGAVPPERASPGRSVEDGEALSGPERQLAGALMRVNHVGEICAQALYEGQALGARDPAIGAQFRKAAGEEADHLAWTRERLEELGARPSLLNPLWYAGAFALGAVAGRVGDRVSLAFMAETERQVEQHLDGHLARLPAQDARSRAIVTVMKDDEVAHAQTAMRLGGAELPAPIKGLMRLAARMMTTSAHYI